MGMWGEQLMHEAHLIANESTLCFCRENYICLKHKKTNSSEALI